jgi:hypothetical protein
VVVLDRTGKGKNKDKDKGQGGRSDGDFGSPLLEALVKKEDVGEEEEGGIGVPGVGVATKGACLLTDCLLPLMLQTDRLALESIGKLQGFEIFRKRADR